MGATFLALHILITLRSQFFRAIPHMPAKLAIPAATFPGCAIGEGLPNPAEVLPYRWSGSLLARLRSHAPDRIAIESERGSWTYGEVECVSAQLQALLEPLVGTGDRPIAIYAHRDPALLFTLLAVIRVGVPFLILDAAYPAERLSQCIAIARPTGLINLFETAPLPKPIAQSLENTGGKILFNWSRVPDQLSRPVAADSRHNETSVGPKDLLYTAFTSGSTGFPKAIIGSHGPVMHFFEWQERHFNLKSSDRVSVLSGIAHDPLLRDILMPLWVGATVCFPSRDCFEVPNRLFAWMRKASVTVAHLTPSLGSLLLAGYEKGSARLDSLRFAFFGGEMLKYSLARKLKEAAPNVTVVNCYGTTETPQVMAFHTVTEDEFENAEPGSVVPIGKGIEGCQLLVLDDKSTLCGDGQEGQIAIRSAYLATRVCGEDGRAADVFKQNPFRSDANDLLYPTGDFGYYRQDGTVVCSGRRDRQLKIRGQRLELGEVERAIASVAGIREYFVDVEERPSSDPSIIAYVVFDTSGDINEDAVYSTLKARLPAFMLPAMIVSVETLPLTPNRKIDLGKLRAHAAAEGRGNGPVSNTGSLESELVGIFARHSPGAALSLDDDFARHGLDSLRAIIVCCAIEKAFHVTLSVQDVFDSKTIRGLARKLAGQNSAVSPDSLPQVAPNDSRVLFPAHENFFRGTKNRILQLLARVAPDIWRAKLHRWRGVRIGNQVSIGYDSILETSYPWLLRIGDHVNIGMRVTLIGHFRGMAERGPDVSSINIEDYAFIGPGVFVLPNVTIGKGAVITAGSVVNTDVAPFVMAHGNPAKPIATCGVSLSGKTTYEEFLRHLRPIPVQD
jgi:amino acid adenylation domain-containing protein